MMEKLCFPGEYLPHGHCYFWEDDLLLFHIISDALIAISYFTIPIFIWRFMQKRNDLGAFKIVFYLFSLFILFCGATHIMEIVTVWKPVYWISGFFKAGTAIVSVITAFAISRLIKPALEIPSTIDLKNANESLQHEVDKNKHLVAELELSSHNLELNVAERTNELHQKTIELKTSLQTIEAANERLAFKSEVLRQVKNAVIAIDLDRRVTYWNAFAETLYGYTAAEVIGRIGSELIVPIRQLEASKDVMATLHKEHHWSGEFELIKKDGTPFFAFVSNTTMFDAEGNKTGFVGISYDISERIQKDQELQLAKEKAEKLAKSKQEFLANMSHEIRTPLNGIIGISNLLEDKDFEDAHTNKLIQMLSYSAKNLNVLINDILDLAKIESGKVTLENEGHLLEEHLQMLAQNFESLCNRKGIDFVFKSEIPKDLFIHSDIYRLTQVVNNLVNNAIKFTLQGNVGLAVGFQKNSDTFVTLTFNITDTGIGLTQEEIQKLSEPFMQANDKIARQFGGTGLGLSIVKSVLQMFNSELIIESKKGTGSSFSFKVEMEIAAQKTAQVASKDRNQQLLTGIKILCVEDNVINQMVIKKMLNNLKAIVDIAADGQSAIDMANATYDIILMDLRLPDFDGFDVTERIVEKLGDKAPAIVACTADVVESTREKVSKSFMQGFIVKPVVEAQLIAIIKELTK